jgi:hypothetical protein
LLLLLLKNGYGLLLLLLHGCCCWSSAGALQSDTCAELKETSNSAAAALGMNGLAAAVSRAFAAEGAAVSNCHESVRARGAFLPYSARWVISTCDHSYSQPPPYANATLVAL